LQLADHDVAAVAVELELAPDDDVARRVDRHGVRDLVVVGRRTPADGRRHRQQRDDACCESDDAPAATMHDRPPQVRQNALEPERSISQPSIERQSRT
jgi:hypothetical protein